MIKRLGSAVRAKFAEYSYMVGYFGKLWNAVFHFAANGKAARKILIMQLLFTYVEALPICGILAVAIGSSIFLLGNSVLASLGQAKLTYDLLVLIVTRELGPLLIAFVVTARSATAIATEIAGMVVSHEIEAYISIGVDPLGHLAAPRFLGVTLSLFFLNIYFSLFGLVAPVIVVQFISKTSMADYFRNLFTSLTATSIYVSCIKSLVFGMLISSTATLYGFNVNRASTEVPVAGIQAVGKAIFFVIIADVFITVLSYLFG